MKKGLLIVSIVFILLFGSLQLFVYLSRPMALDELRVKVATLPSATLQNLDGSPFTFPQGKSLVLIYFNTTCEHCQLELSDIRESINLFSSTELVLMSSQASEEVMDFAGRLKFDSPNVHFVLITHEQLAEAFGSLALPQIFVYAPDGKLVTLFVGETSPQVITQSLR